MTSRIVYVGHATVLVEFDGVRLLTDPLVRRRLLHLRRVGRAAVAPPTSIDAVLLSHVHFDHLDFPSLRQLGREVRVVVPRGAGRLVARKGFENVSELGVGEGVEIGAVGVRGVPAVHPAGRMPFGARVDPMGFVLSGSRSVYFAGDTDLFEGMAELAPLDVALLPIWGWGPSLGHGHLDPRSAAEAARLLRPSIAIPIHWGTYFPSHAGLRRLPAFLERPAAQFSAHMAELAPTVELRILRPGEETAI